jgi:hypothetical protein
MEIEHANILENMEKRITFSLKQHEKKLYFKLIINFREF